MTPRSKLIWFIWMLAAIALLVGLCLPARGALYYQWMTNGIPLSDGLYWIGSTTPTLAVTNAGTNFNGRILSVLVSNACGSVTSGVATLTVTNCNPPSISSQPSSVTCVTNSTTNFSITASGDSPISYRWQTNSVDVSNGNHWAGASTSSLWISNTIAGDSNLLARCILSNSCGIITSSVATLTVTNGVGGGGSTSNLVGYWAFDDNLVLSNTVTSATNSVSGGSSATLTGAYLWTAGHIAGAIKLTSGAYASAGSAAECNLTNSGTVAAWFNVVGIAVHQMLVCKGNLGTDRNGYLVDIAGNSSTPHVLVELANTSTNQIVTGTTTFSVNVWHHVAVTWDGSWVQIYIDGTLDSVGAVAQTLNVNSAASTLYFGKDNGVTAPYSGYLDDLRIYNYALSPSAIAALAGM